MKKICVVGYFWGTFLSFWREIFCHSVPVSLLSSCFFFLVLFFEGYLRISVPLPLGLVPLQQMGNTIPHFFLAQIRSGF